MPLSGSWLSTSGSSIARKGLGSQCAPNITRRSFILTCRSLDGNPSEVAAAVRKLWHPGDLEEQNAEVERLGQLSPTLDTYAHSVAILQQCRELLSTVLDSLKLDGRSQLAALVQDAKKSQLLMDSVGAHCRSAAVRIMAKKFDTEELTGALVLPFMVRNLGASPLLLTNKTRLTSA